ncbi:MAG: hypothetical protein JXM69_00870 [Anaerolineae bacterium]|nr:hypothetical protein [Anaerolineae bacterium]
MSQKQASTNNTSFTVSLHGATLRLETEQQLFLTYAQQYLADLLTSEETSPGVRVCLHWDACPSQAWYNGSVRYWGRRIWQVGNKVLQTETLYLPGLQLAAEWSNRTLIIDAYYRPVSKLQRLRFRFGREIPSVFIILIYYLIYFPLINYLEQTRGWGLLHAGAVSRPDGAWILSGLPGSGKSTFTFSLLAHPQARFLADNLLLFDAEAVYALPEPIRLSLDSRALLPSAAKQRLVDTGRNFTHGRRDFLLRPEDRDWQNQPQALLFLGLANRAGCQPISPGMALDRLLASNQTAREIHLYTQFAAALNLISPNPDMMGDRHIATLRTLLSRLACYEFWLAKGQELDQAVDLANQILTVAPAVMELE